MPPHLYPICAPCRARPQCRHPQPHTGSGQCSCCGAAVDLPWTVEADSLGDMILQDPDTEAGAT